MRNVGLKTSGFLLAAAITALTATQASARVVCNEEGDCWHVQTDYEYQPGYRLTVHPDDWRWKDDHKNRWREHEGRGYWRGGTWMTF